ncbi:MAG: 3-hydroxyacyl-CoA dehydrogenase [Geminicoccaceae bacterium]|nr:3-hydroxyacyl-CoA dehydrogenase [Geminicoccaceae bacterium]MCS7268060.1 3-hydroxyacyl-CoA dehydrogenase [Geminicoccaceae bacterium]MCX7631461.1 3-hydroxyacyl-CoA dehydrogenase [Geminicoccaceae bacterium]MDW8124772.1 3-hydroxyacyl-CoA dehydrogenase [Geminicoccaceae bacterium]MDW8342350.1 3-hydroxyacyl-CoA dehydrogenase [Geminicoccaceae bacterium]
MSEERICAIVGCGLIGRAWAVDFARGGWTVRLFDPVAGVVDAALSAIDGMLSDLVASRLLEAPAKDEARSRLLPASSLEAALAGAAWVQENAPERLEIKRELWRALDRLAPPEAVLASSTSAILPSRFTDDLPGRARALVVHPLNPPHLVPAVELCPAPWTSLETILRAEEVVRGLGHSVIRLAREIDGFVMNRLQAALVEEAFKLVAAGICTAEEIDIALRDGLALRWCFAGPFEVGDLNAPGGIRDYVVRYRDVFESVLASALPRPDWTGPVLDEIEHSRRLRLLAEEIPHRQRWRDRRLMALLRHKREVSETIGD